MIIAGRTFQYFHRSAAFLSSMCLAFSVASLFAAGCSETAKPVVSPANGQVDTYFGAPFTGSAVGLSETTFDHFGNQLVVSGFSVTGSAHVPVNIINGTFTPADTGFLAITENFAITPAGPLTPQNPPLTGAWAVEIPGAGALANLLSINTGSTVSAAPSAMAQNNSCPTAQATSSNYLYVTVPNSSNLPDTADYGTVNLVVNGSAVTFNAQPYLLPAQAQPASVVTGGCSITNLGALTAYPLNSFGTASNLELISLGQPGLLVSSFNAGPASAPGAFGGGTGVLGVTAPDASVDASSVAALQYNGFIYSPRNTAQQSFDITVLASAFGNHSASSQECSALQASLAGNNGGGNGLVPVLPSPNSIYGGEFVSNNGTTNVNDPTGANGSENCDVVIDLGTQDSTTNGLFPNATVFIGSTFPPFSVSNPWNCGAACAVSFPAAAVVGKVLGKYVIFISSSDVSSPPAQLPDASGSLSTQPVGIYLFQK